MFLSKLQNKYQQEHPRGSLVEPQSLHQNGFNSLSYNGLNTLIIIAHFLIATENEIRSSWSWFEHCSQHSSSLQGVISGHYLPKVTWKVDQKWNYVNLESIRTLLIITRLTHSKSCLIIIYPNLHEKLIKSEIRSSWTRFEYCSESLF